MNPTIHNYGSNFYSPQTGALQGQVKFDANTGLALQPGQSTVIQPNIPSVVPVANISNKPVNLMTPPVATAGVGASAALADQALSVQDQFLRDLQAKQDALGVQQEKQLTGIEDVYSRLFGQGQRNEQIIKDLGVDEAKKELNNYTNQIRAEQNALNNQIKAIASSGGMTKEQAQPQIAELTRQSVSKQADLAVLQGAAADNFDAVSAAADRKIKSETESLQLELQARQFFFQNNKDDFNKAEQRTYEQQNKKIEQEIKNKEIGQQMIVEAVAYGAPQSVIKQAQALYNQGADPTVIAKTVGTYSKEGSDAITQRLQRENLRSQISERQSSGNTNGTINGKPQNASQAIVNTYANRLNESNVTLDNLAGKFTGAGTAINNFLGKFSPNFLKGSDRQAVEQAEKNFITAILRRESGAAIAPSEFKTAAELYFPQPGDTPETVAAKAVTRNNAVNNFYREANAFRPTLPGQIIEADDGKKYKVAPDGQNLIEL